MHSTNLVPSHQTGVWGRSQALVIAALALFSASESAAQPEFPVTVEPFIEGRFEGAEGIAFNGEGKMFVTADRAL